MNDYETTRIPCSRPGCAKSHANHKWGYIKAHDSGWFDQKDGLAWCPDHTPDWVKAWREDKK